MCMCIHVCFRKHYIYMYMYTCTYMYTGVGMAVPKHLSPSVPLPGLCHLLKLNTAEGGFCHLSFILESSAEDIYIRVISHHFPKYCHNCTLFLYFCTPISTYTYLLLVVYLQYELVHLHMYMYVYVCTYRSLLLVNQYLMFPR